MFGNWLNGIDNKDKARIHIGVSAFRWSIWKCRNNIVFNKTRCTNFFAGYQFGFPQDLSLVLLSVDQWEPIVYGCNRLLAAAHDIYSLPSWRYSSRLQDRYLLDASFTSLVDSCIDLM
jgi:hypothetical protein